MGIFVYLVGWFWFGGFGFGFLGFLFGWLIFLFVLLIFYFLLLLFLFKVPLGAGCCKGEGQIQRGWEVSGVGVHDAKIPKNQ